MKKVSFKTGMILLTPVLLVAALAAGYMYLKKNTIVVGDSKVNADLSIMNAIRQSEEQTAKKITVPESSRLQFSNPNEAVQFAARGDQLMQLQHMNFCRQNGFKPAGCEKFAPKK